MNDSVKMKFVNWRSGFAALFSCFFVACGPAPLAVSDSGGNAVNIPVSKNRPICAMATWCPYSKQFRDALKDARLKPYLKDIKMVFLYEESEWPTIERQLKEQAKGEGMTEEDIQTILTTLKAKAKFGPVFDPDFFDSAVASDYYAKSDSGIKFRGFPSMLSVSKREFGQHPLEWLEEDIKVPQALLMTIWKSHSPKGEP